MEIAISVERADVSDIDGAVSHIDELDDETRDYFLHLIEEAPSTAEVDDSVPSRLSRREYIKYVEYYRITPGALSVCSD